MPPVRRFLEPLLALLVLCSIAFFFERAFQRNWLSVRAHPFSVAPAFLVSSALGTASAMLLSTYAWYTASNALSARRISFAQSIAVNNASSLTKYIPGKVFSYALQMYWLDGLGFSKALILYINLINALISTATTVMLGLGCLILARAGSSPLFLLLVWFFGLIAVEFINKSPAR